MLISQKTISGLYIWDLFWTQGTPWNHPQMEKPRCISNLILDFQNLGDGCYLTYSNNSMVTTFSQLEKGEKSMCVLRRCSNIILNIWLLCGHPYVLTMPKVDCSIIVISPLAKKLEIDIIQQNISLMHNKAISCLHFPGKTNVNSTMRWGLR